MNRDNIHTRDMLIGKLKELGFCGPLSFAGHQFMRYHGRLLKIPPYDEYSIPRFRFVLKEIDKIVSQDKWNL